MYLAEILNMKFMLFTRWIFAFSCTFFTAQLAAAVIQPIALENFGDPKAQALWQALRQLEKGETTNAIRLMQFGDSHTGGDFFSGRLRDNFQARFGDAGIGWLTPGYISNQRSASALLKNLGHWTLSDSKQLKHSGPFPLGGLMNRAEGASLIEIKPKAGASSGIWRLSLWQESELIPWRLVPTSGLTYKLSGTQKLNTGWQLSSLELEGSNIAQLKLLAPQGGKLGAIILDHLQPGVTLDAVGINGAKASAILRWEAAAFDQQLRWRNPRLIILAYGTNEAFDPDMKIDEFEADLRRIVQGFRASAPNAAILMLGAPSAAKKKQPSVYAGCRIGLPPMLANIKAAQRRVAKIERTLFWDWAEFMGGSCGAQVWFKQKPALMRPDLIHLTPEGYSLSADALFEEMMNFVDMN